MVPESDSCVQNILIKHWKNKIPQLMHRNGEFYRLATSGELRKNT